MRGMRKLLLGTAILSLAGWLSVALAEDWPQWCGDVDRNMVSSETGLSVWFDPGDKRPGGGGIDPRSTKNVKWTVRLGSQTYGTPTIADGRVYVGTNDFSLRDPRCKPTRGGLMLCVDEATGKLLWRLIAPRRNLTLLGDEFEGAHFNHLNCGLCSSATVEGDRVYVITSRGEAVCLDAQGMADGNDGPFVDEGQYIAGQYNTGAANPAVEVGPTDADVIWMVDLVTELPSCPQDAACGAIMIHGDLLYVSTSNGVDESHDKPVLPLAPTLVVLEKKTGRLVAVDDEKISTRLLHGHWTSPTMGRIGGKTQIYFCGGDGLCYAFQAIEKVTESTQTLKKVWSFDCNPPEYKFRDGKPIPYRSGDKRIRSRWEKQGIVANKNDGKFIGPSEIIATPVFHKNRIYVATGQDPEHGLGKAIMTCIDATQTGDVTKTAKIWSREIQRSLSTVSISDGLLYLADESGALHCLDVDTGEPYWVHETKEEIWASTLVADGKIYLPTKRLLWILAAGKQCKVLGRVSLRAPTWCTPVAANGVLYVASNHYLWAVQGDEPPPETSE